MSAHERRLIELEREVRRLRQGIAQRPIKPPKGSGAAPSLRVITIIGGNTLGTGQTGIKYSSSAITDVGSSYNPDVDTSFSDGIGRGTLSIDGVIQSSKVLVCNDSTGAAITFALLASDVVVTAATKTVTVGGDPNTTLTVYVPLFM